MRRLLQLEEENRRPKAIVADQALDIRALKDVLAKNGYGPPRASTISMRAYRWLVRRVSLVRLRQPAPAALRSAPRLRVPR
jgi:hypothetical protein